MRRTLFAFGALVLALSAVVSARPPDQPYMESARANLFTAKRELQIAAQNKGGHRVKAIEYVNNAIAEVNLGIRFARHNNHALAGWDKIFENAGSAPDQPHMQAALDALRSARRNLDSAVADKGGHRVKAIGYVNSAIDEVEKGIAAGA